MQRRAQSRERVGTRITSLAECALQRRLGNRRGGPSLFSQLVKNPRRQLTTLDGVARRTWRTEGSVDTFIAAPLGDVYAAVADVTRIGERSPECRAAEWLPGSTPGQVGSRFRGRNRSGIARWSRVCEVTANDPRSRFVFRTVPERIDPSRRDSTTWSYTFVPEGHGTRVTHSYEVTMLPSRPFRALYGWLLPHHRDMRPQMTQTLAALKEALEG